MTSPTKAAELAELIAWHEGQACHARYAANAGTAVKHEEPRKGMLLKQAEFHDKAAALLRASEGRVPDVLFDGYAVLQALDKKARARTSADNVSDVLDAVVRLLRAQAAAPHPPAQQAEPTVTIETAVLHMGMTVFWSQLVEALRADGFDLGEGKVKAGPAMIAFVKRETETLLKASDTPPHKAEGAEPVATVITDHLEHTRGGRSFEIDTALPVGTKLYATPQHDPLQGAVNWLCEARLDISVTLIQQKLHIGYNRAKRLLDAATTQEPSA